MPRRRPSPCRSPPFAAAQEQKFTVGVVLPLSGTFAEQGRHYEDGINLFQKLHGNKVGNITVETVVRDDQGPGSGDLARRLTQELILRNKADIILGYSFTPNAMASATLLTEAKKPAIIINAATSIITEKSPYFSRVSFTLPQLAATLGMWAAKNNVKTAYTIVSDYAPGIDAETWFTKSFEAGGGKIVGGLATIIFGPQQQPVLLPGWLVDRIDLFGLPIAGYRLFLCICGLIAAVALVTLFDYTLFGAKVRASVDNRRMAEGIGINVGWLFSITFGLGSALAGLGGALAVGFLGLDPSFPLKYLVIVLMVVAIGGPGSIAGSFTAAIFLGVADALFKYLLPEVGSFVIYGLLVAMMIFFPKGIAGRTA